MIFKDLVDKNSQERRLSSKEMVRRKPIGVHYGTQDQTAEKLSNMLN